MDIPTVQAKHVVRQVPIMILLLLVFIVGNNESDAFAFISHTNVNQCPRTVIGTFNPPAGTSTVVTTSTQRTQCTRRSKSSNDEDPSRSSSRQRMRSKLKKFAKSIIVRPTTTVDSTARPQDIVEILADASLNAVEIAKETVHMYATERSEKLADTSKGMIRNSRALSEMLEAEAEMEGDTAMALDTIALAKTTAADAFALAEEAIEETEKALANSKIALQNCRRDVSKAIVIAETSALQANIASQKATALAATAAAVSSAQSSSSSISFTGTGTSANVNVNANATGGDKVNIVNDGVDDGGNDTLKTLDEDDQENGMDTSSLSYEDVDYHLSEMSPPFIGEDQCLVPGEAVVRVEKAAENSRRIFAGIDILASVDDVWNLLTDYENLQQVVPNLVVNEVVGLYSQEPGSENYEVHPDVGKEEEINAIKSISKTLKGATLKQVGGAKVVGINFSAAVTLEVREWPNGIPFVDETTGYDGKTERKRKLERYRFPRPFAISQLPTKDISMQSVENDDGEFRLYQGVWRMQPLPGCAPENGAAMRLTYAVEISPRPYLPVQFVEGRISQDLCNNLIAIRDHIASKSATTVVSR